MRARMPAFLVIALLLCSIANALAGVPAYAINGPYPNLATIETEIARYYTSGRHEADVATVDARLQSYVDARLRSGVRRPAVVLDIDDTALSTFTYEQQHDFSYTSTSWNQWERADRFPVMVPTLRLVRHLTHEHVAIFWVTGRRVDQRNVTLHELQLAGYPPPAGLYLRPLSDHARSVVPFKSAARALIEQMGYDVLASIGDQWSDLLGGHADRLYKLPNPIYYLP